MNNEDDTSDQIQGNVNANLLYGPIKKRKSRDIFWCLLFLAI